MAVYKEADYKEKLFQVYKGYKSMYDNGVELALVIRNFGTANNYYNPNAWRVISITEKAYQVIKDSGFKKPGKEINRSHITDKNDFIGDLMKREVLNTADQLISYLDKNDLSVLSTSSENLTEKDIYSLGKYEIPEGLFLNQGLFGMRFNKKTEVEFLKSL